MTEVWTIAEYIDRANLIARIKYYVTHTPEGSGEHYAYSVVLNEILNHPAADVAPVVHCKDCKHFNHKRMECENEAVSTDHEGGAQYSLNFWLDDFCSYGERKDGKCG